MDIHVGQSYSFLVTMDQNATSDYYIVASSRWNVSAIIAHPNPQGSFRYGQITITDVYVILNRPAELIDGKWRATVNATETFLLQILTCTMLTTPGIWKNVKCAGRWFPKNMLRNTF